MSSRERSESPTTALWDGRNVALQNRARMISMGLHVFNEEWNVTQVRKGRMFSTSFRETCMKVLGKDDAITFPIQTCTQVRDVKNALSNALLTSPDSLKFVIKQGCSFRELLDIEEMGSKVTVKGIDGFRPQPHRWPHPIAILGSGYHGLKTCLAYIKSRNTNFVCFDRNDRVGGYCWITAANKTSKLQTEFGSFHIWWGQDFTTHGALGYPSGWDTYPYKTQVLAHFQHAAEEYGILPHIRFKSDVVDLSIVGDRKDEKRHYDLSVRDLDDAASVNTVSCSVMYNFPGSMTRNRIIEYPGEDTFTGYIRYGMNDDTPYEHLKGSNSAIIGNGAFAVENIRTCLEYEGEKVYLLTRRKNLASPRVPCWYVHQSPAPVPGRLVLKMFEPMYQLCGFDDPWGYWSVHATSDRARVNIIQNSRFGIGDVTFLAVAYGKAEFIEDTLKRVQGGTLHLSSGRKLSNISVVIKSLGLLGDFQFDRLHKMRELLGSFCDRDWRRTVMIDDPGMNAANFITFSTGIGTTGWVRTHKFLHDFPKEYYRMERDGLLQQLPVNKANEKLDKPCYVGDVKFKMTASIITESMNPKITELNAPDGEYKYRMYHASHPFDKFLEECIESWDKYQSDWQQQGSKHEYMPYPYTEKMVNDYFADFSKHMGFPIGIDGPPKEQPPPKVEQPSWGDRPAWAINEDAVQQAEQAVAQDTSNYWASQQVCSHLTIAQEQKKTRPKAK